MLYYPFVSFSESDSLHFDHVLVSRGDDGPIPIYLRCVYTDSSELVRRNTTMITRAEAAALRVTWKARAGTLTCLHHYLFLDRITSKRSTKNYLCMDCGAAVVGPSLRLRKTSPVFPRLGEGRQTDRVRDVDV